MRSFDLRVRFPTGTILVGGHSALPGGVSSSHAVDHRGRAVLPATALRGALREMLEAILRGVGRGACDAGSGLDPATASADDTPRECTVDQGRRCIPCRIFGTRRAAVSESERAFSSLILGDATLEGDEALEWVARQHVSIARSRRSAEDKRLFQHRTPDLMHRTLVARGYSVDEELAPYLEAAVRGTKHIGSGRSVGLARVELELEWGEDVELAGGEVQPDGKDGRDIEVRVRLESPTALGTAEASNNYRTTRSEIPGSVLRGAIGFAIARAMPEQLSTDPDTPFQALVDESEGAQFGFLYPVEHELRDSGAPSVGPWPVTARACKAHGTAHGVVDTLLDRIAIASIDSSAQANGVNARVLRNCRAQKPHCDAPLRSAPGSRAYSGAPPKRVITRVSIDRRSTSARDGALFSYELLEPGTVLQGTIRNVPEGSRDLLARALQLPIFIGRGSSSGWGRISVEVVDPPARPTLEQRGIAFESALRRHLEAADLPTAEVDHLVPMTFLAPFLPTGDDDTRSLDEHVGEGTRWVVVARRFEREGGWDQRTGRPFAELAVAAGAVYVARLTQPWRTMLSTLHELERSGAGRRRHQGYGHLILFDPFILNRGDHS